MEIIAPSKGKGKGVMLDNYGSSKVFLGCTGEGSFPPVGAGYSRMAFFPKEGVPGIVVFKGISDTLSFYQYEWKNGKVVVEQNIKHTLHPFSQSEQFGFMVYVGKTLYVTTEPKPGVDFNGHTVDLLVLLKYLEGKVDAKELHRSSRSLFRRKRYFEEVENLRSSNRWQKDIISKTRKEREQWKQGANDAREALSKFAGWIRSLLALWGVRFLINRTKEGRKTLAMIEQLLGNDSSQRVERI